MTQFQDKWVKSSSPSIGEKLTERLKSQPPLKPQIETGIKRINTQITKLDSMLTKLNDRQKQIFEKVVDATREHDVNKSHILANELAEIRKVITILSNTRMSLEQIELRLTTAHDLGDTVVTILPTIGLMKNLQSSLARFMPGADREIAGMADALNGLMFDTFSSDNAFNMDASTSEASETILQEAAAVAQTSLSDKLPSMPDSQTEYQTSKYT